MSKPNEGLAVLLAMDMQATAVELKVKYERFIDTCVSRFGFTKEEAVAFANERIDDVNTIGDEFFRMKKEGKTPEEMHKELPKIMESMDKKEERK